MKFLDHFLPPVKKKNYFELKKIVILHNSEPISSFDFILNFIYRV